MFSKTLHWTQQWQGIHQDNTDNVIRVRWIFSLIVSILSSLELNVLVSLQVWGCLGSWGGGIGANYQTPFWQFHLHCYSRVTNLQYLCVQLSGVDWQDRDKKVVVKFEELYVCLMFVSLDQYRITKHLVLPSYLVVLQSEIYTVSTKTLVSLYFGHNFLRS